MGGKQHQQLDYVSQHHLHHGHHGHQSGAQTTVGNQYHHSGSPSALLINLNSGGMRQQQQQQSPNTMSLNQAAVGFNSALINSNDVQSHHGHHSQQSTGWTSQSNESIDPATQLYTVSLNQPLHRSTFPNQGPFLIESRTPTGSTTTASYHPGHIHHHHHHMGDERLQFIASYDSSAAGIIPNQGSTSEVANSSSGKSGSKHHSKNQSNSDAASKSQAQWSPKAGANFQPDSGANNVPENMQLGINGMFYL